MKKNGGPAFPTRDVAGMQDDMGGMSLRDYFAAKTMQALARRLPNMKPGCTLASNNQLLKDIAEASYEMADAMLRERGE